MRLLTRTLAVAACATLTLVASASAKGAPEGFFGMVAYEPPTTAEFQQMAGAGTETYRATLSWGEVEPTPGIRNWAPFDAIVANATAAGMRTLPTLFGSAPFVHSVASRPPIFTPSQRSAWMTFIGDVARRYGPGGEFWAVHPELPSLPVTDWQVWNEANLADFWGGKPRPAQYADLLDITAAALRSVDPAATIITSGLFHTPRRGYGPSAEKFLNKLYSTRGARADFDAVGLHPYAERPPEVLETTRDIRSLISRRDSRRTGLWITEVGWTTGGQGFAKTPYKASESSQAKKLSATYRLLLGSRRALRLQGVVWHAWRDVPRPDARLWTQFMGLLRADGTAKPSLRAYGRLAGRT